MKLKTLVISAASVALLASTAVTAKPVGIVKGVMEVAGISRNQDNKATIHPAFAKTSRPCPPFCIQPTHPFAPASVETVSELDICLIRISITASGSLATALAFNFLKEIFTEPLIVPPFLADIHTGVRASRKASLNITVQV
jgi:hypothetical protein